MVTTWPQLLVETMSWSMILLQLGSAVMSVACVNTEVIGIMLY